MSGHSKWSKVKHQKAVTDARKSRVFSKLAQVITIESKKALGDSSAPNVRQAVERAKAANMPQANIERAIARGTGKEAAKLEEVIYEAYGPGGVALIIEGITDNRNRTASEVKHALLKQGGTLAQPGAASWAFEKQDNKRAPKATVEISESDQEKTKILVRALKELDDVQAVYTNAA